MANIILTTDCQRKCAYCFAQEDKTKHISFTLDNFKVVAKFVATGPKVVNMLGGEPTLNKDFVRMLEYLLVNDFMVQVFTNGMLSNKVLYDIMDLLNRTALKEDQLYFAININEEKYRTEDENKLQSKFMKNLGNLVYPSFTIQDKEVNLLFLVDLINNYSLDPTIRLGLAMPAGNNKYLPINDYVEVASNIVELTEESNGIVIKFDCGFPLCMFTLEELGKLSQNKENDFVFLCGQPIDIYPDLTFTNCYPLSNKYKGKLIDFKGIMDIYKFLEEGFMTPIGIFGDKCSDCTFFRKVCFGGCKGFFGLPKVGG